MIRPRTSWLPLAALAAAAAAAVAALAATAGHSAAARHVVTPGVANAALYHRIGNPQAGTSGTVRFDCQTNDLATDGLICYGPDQIRAAYGIQPLLDRGYDGSGKTIAIVDAYGSPTIQDDLALFDQVWGLPEPDFEVVAPFGVDPTDPNNAAGWAGETSLDVEWAHAVAPGAKILLVVAKSNDDADILAATQWIYDHDAGDVLSQSYGEAEQCVDPALMEQQHELFRQMTRRDITLFASSGDQGAGIPNCDGTAYIKATSSPASDPYVTSVGGTMLNADGVSGDYRSETTWNESTVFGDAVAGGGGVSIVYSRPSYQQPLLGGSRDSSARHDRGDRGDHGGHGDHGDHGQKMRTVPDVSYNAGVFTGVLTAWGGSFWLFGGTSAGSPQWAGLAAIADQLGAGRVGAINPALYKAGKNDRGGFFHDVADGSNNSIPDLTPYLGASFGTPIDGFTAVPGYDLATGLGTPIASSLLPYLARSGSHGDSDHGWGSVGSSVGGANGRHGHKREH